MNKYAVSLLCDSGAFSAWTRNESIDLAAYIKFVQEYKHLLWQYVCLDVIPGRLHERRTPEQLEAGAMASYRNLQIMKDAGLRPIPVFHQQEDFKWLDKMLKDGEDYIGISPLDDTDRRSQVKWMDQCFSVLTDSKGYPLVKTHGFGTTHPLLMFRYPWSSADSTTWVLTPAYGQIYVPVYEEGRPNYHAPPMRVIMSGEPRASAASNKNQFDMLGPRQQDTVRQFLQEEVGVCVGEARYLPNARRKCVLIYYQRLAEQTQGVRFLHKSSSLLNGYHSFSKKQGIKGMQMHMVFATVIAPALSQLLNDANARYRLLSYYMLRETPDLLEHYVTHGAPSLERYERKQPKPDWKSKSYRNYRLSVIIRRGEKSRLEREQNATQGIPGSP